MNAERVAFFKAHSPALIQVTLYGASEEAYERVTGKRAFARVMENLHRLREAELPLLVSTTPNAFMTDGEALVQLLHAEGFPFQINSGLVRPRGNRASAGRRGFGRVCCHVSSAQRADRRDGGA